MKSRFLARTILPYAAFAALWIYFSDRVLAGLVTGPLLLTRLQTYKGLAFVLITALLLYGLLRRELLRRESAERRLGEESARLAHAANEAMESRNALAASEQRFRATFEQAAVGIAHVAPDGRWLRINQKLCDIVGYSREELLARTFLDITHPDDVDADLAFVRQMLAGEIQTYTLEKRYLRKGGAIVWTNVTVSRVRRANGGSDYVIAVVEDISERKRAEAALQESERRFRSTLENIQLLAVGLDTEGRITFCNDFLLARTGWRREEVSGRDWFETFLPEGGRGSIRELFQQAVTRGDLPLRYENEILTRAGDRRLVHWNNTVLHDPAGHIVGTVSLGEDITDRHHAQLALQQSEKRLRHLIDGLGPHNFVGLLTPEGIIVEANRSALTAAGLTPADVQGRAFEDSYWWSYSPAVQRQLREAVVRAARGEPSRYDVQIRVGEGRFAILDFSVQPMRDESGRIVFLVPSAVVITERMEAERKLRESTRQLEILSRRLLAAQETERRHIARELHDEIGQLLTVVKLELQTVLRQPGTAALMPAVKESMESIDRVVARVRDLSLDLRPSMLDDLGLLPTLRWYVQRQSQRLGAGIEIALTLPPSMPDLAGETATACFRVAQEALTNVARHSGAQRIEVTLDATEHGIELTVRDDGRGFEPEMVHQQALNGGGFGLLGMQERAELAGGRLTVVSEPGRGTTVRARFPAVSAQEPVQ